MKKVILLFLITAIMFSCEKNETTQPADQYAEVSFNVTTLVPDAGREWEYTYDVPECDPNAIPGWALMKITDADGVELEGDGIEGPNGINYFKAMVFYTNGELYTQTIKLPVTMCDDAPTCCETYWVTEFYMYDEEGDPEWKHVFTNPVNPDTDGDSGVSHPAAPIAGGPPQPGNRPGWNNQ